MSDFASLLPFPTEVAEGSLHEARWSQQATEGERSAIADASAPRRREFLAGRGCAHIALARLTRSPVGDIAVGERREPRWPRGVIGSITHAAGRVAAVVARDDAARALGIDMEPRRTLDGATADFVLGPEERSRAAEAAGAWGEILAFSAKESVFKAWYPLTGRWLEPEHVSVAIRADGTFGTTLAGARWIGAWRIDAGIVRTAAACLAA